MDLKKVLRRTRIKLKAIRLPKKKHKLDITFDEIPLYKSNKPICPYGRTCALISDSKHQQNYTHEYGTITTTTTTTMSNKNTVHSKYKVSAPLHIESTKSNIVDKDDEEQKQLEKELSERLTILAKRRYEKLGIEPSDLKENIRKKEDIISSSDDEDKEEDDDEDDGTDTIRSVKYSVKKQDTRTKIIIKNSPNLSEKKRKRMLKKKIGGQNEPMKTIVEAIHLDSRTEEEKEHESKYILKRILKERDFMPRVVNSNGDNKKASLFFSKLAGGKRNFLTGILKQSQQHSKRKQQGATRKNKFDEIRIAMKFWLNLSLRKSINSWIAYTYKAKQVKKLTRSAIDHWGYERLR